MIMSHLFTLNVKDALNGFLVTVLGAFSDAIVQILTPCLDAGAHCTLDLNFKRMAYVALITGIVYLGKRFGSNSTGEVLKK